MKHKQHEKNINGHFFNFMEHLSEANFNYITNANSVANEQCK